MPHPLGQPSASPPVCVWNPRFSVTTWGQATVSSLHCSSSRLTSPPPSLLPTPVCSLQSTKNPLKTLNQVSSSLPSHWLLCLSKNTVYLPASSWDGQKVRSHFSGRCYWKTPIIFGQPQNISLPGSALVTRAFLPFLEDCRAFGLAVCSAWDVCLYLFKYLLKTHILTENDK